MALFSKTIKHNGPYMYIFYFKSSKIIPGHHSVLRPCGEHCHHPTPNLCLSCRIIRLCSKLHGRTWYFFSVWNKDTCRSKNNSVTNENMNFVWSWCWGIKSCPNIKKINWDKPLICYGTSTGSYDRNVKLWWLLVLFHKQELKIIELIHLLRVMIHMSQI